VTADARSELLTDFSPGMTGKEVGELEQARAVIPPGTRVHVGFVDSEDLATRLSAAEAVRGSGLVPVPVIAARRLRSEGMLREYLSGLRAADASDCVLVVAGDPAQPRGPYGSSWLLASPTGGYASRPPLIVANSFAMRRWRVSGLLAPSMSRTCLFLRP